MIFFGERSHQKRRKNLERKNNWSKSPYGKKLGFLAKILLY